MLMSSHFTPLGKLWVEKKLLIRYLVLCRIERRPPRLDLTIYPYLPQATVATTSARSYMSLLVGGATS